MSSEPETGRERLRVSSGTFDLVSMWATPRNDEFARDNTHLQEALALNKREGMRLALRARFVAIAVTAVLLAINVPWPAVLYYWLFLALFAFLGWLQWRQSSVGQSRVEIGLLMLDSVLLTYMMVAPNPLADWDWPVTTSYRFEAFKYLFIFLAATTIGYSWRTVFSFGTWTALAWLTGAFVVWRFSVEDLDLRARLLDAVGGDSALLAAVDVTQVNWLTRIEEAVIFLLVTVILGVNGFRMNRLLLKQAEITRERANLARHFAPSMVELMAERDDALTDVREVEAAVVFVDIVGFTAFAEQNTPERTIGTLRRFHGEIERHVFDCGGTLDKFLGDGAMASFGTPFPREGDARRALECVRRLARISLAPEGLAVAVGGHWGSVVLGDIGSARRLEFATIGDTVNVAARLEEATRAAGVRALVSDRLIAAAGDHDGLVRIDPLILRGRTVTVDAWAIA